MQYAERALSMVSESPIQTPITILQLTSPERVETAMKNTPLHSQDHNHRTTVDAPNPLTFLVHTASQTVDRADPQTKGKASSSHNVKNAQAALMDPPVEGFADTRPASSNDIVAETIKTLHYLTLEASTPTKAGAVNKDMSAPPALSLQMNSDPRTNGSSTTHKWVSSDNNPITCVKVTVMGGTTKISSSPEGTQKETAADDLRIISCPSPAACIVLLNSEEQELPHDDVVPARLAEPITDEPVPNKAQAVIAKTVPVAAEEVQATPEGVGSVALQTNDTKPQASIPLENGEAAVGSRASSAESQRDPLDSEATSSAETEPNSDSSPGELSRSGHQQSEFVEEVRCPETIEVSPSDKRDENLSLKQSPFVEVLHVSGSNKESPSPIASPGEVLAQSSTVAQAGHTQIGLTHREPIEISIKGSCLNIETIRDAS
eukprot:GHVN01002019.1.p1 GENE.GHVN01002019.1~~GHVN01002019.1.p1  ORF type:complete len:433 (+),score=57.04 GHVN01002019.1:6704-8002(+)